MKHKYCLPAFIALAMVGASTTAQAAPNAPVGLPTQPDSGDAVAEFLGSVEDSMVTIYRSGNDIRLSHHTTDTLNKPLKDLLGGNRVFFAHAM